MSHDLTPLIDAFGRVHTYLRISVTDRCNLRCRYCMPPQGIDWKPRAEVLTYEEIVRLARLFARMGITKIRLTGGEPLIRRDLAHLIGQLRALPGIRDIGLTTNGVLLPGQVDALHAAGVTHLNISLDTLSRKRFAEITLRDDFDAVMAAIEVAIGAGFAAVKINVVVMGGVNDDELVDFVRFFACQPVELRFIEYMPFAGNGWNRGALISFADMHARISTEFELRARTAEVGAVARDYDLVSHRAQIGFITSMTDEFCSSCNRVRLTADGAVRPCLHDPAEVSLRDRLRAGSTDAELERLIRGVMRAKPEKHIDGEQLVQLGGRSMIQIGG